MIDYVSANSWAVEKKTPPAPVLTWSLSFKRAHRPAPPVKSPEPPGPVFTAFAYLCFAVIGFCATVAAFALLGPWAFLLFCPAVVVIRPDKGWGSK